VLTQLTMLQHADAAFPSGSFAFSNGVEGLASLGAPLSGIDLSNALAVSIRHRWAGTDRVALIAAYRSANNPAALSRIDAALEAATLAMPMRTGSKRNGQSLLAAHVRLGTPGADDLQKSLQAGRLLGHLAVIQAVLWQALGIGEREAVLMSGYQAASSMTAAAVRLGQIGAIDAQRSLAGALVVIAEISESPVNGGLTDKSPADQSLAEKPDDAIVLTSFIPFIEIAAMRNAEADLRLFAN
jgi:urease accessory protein